MSKRWMAALGLVVLCGLAAACGSGSPSKSASGSTTSTTSKVRATTTTGVAPTTATTPTTAGGVPACAGANVGVSAKTEGAAAGHQGVVLLFVNNGANTCALYGYPGVAGLDSSGAQLAQAQRTLTGMMGGLAAGDTTIPVIDLVKGQSASAVVEGTDVTSGTETTCPTYASLLVTPPNTMVSTTIQLSLPGCAGLEVHPVVAGLTGSAQS